MTSTTVKLAALKFADGMDTSPDPPALRGRVEVIRVRVEEQDIETDGNGKSGPRFSWEPVMETVARIL